MAINKKKEQDLSKGIKAEQYDIEPTLKNNEIDLEGKEHIKINYSFNAEEITQGLKIYQKETIYKRNYIYTAILFVIFILYVLSIVKDPSQMFSKFMAMISVSVLAFIWYTPAAYIKRTAKATKDNAMEFTMEVYDECIKIGEQEASYVLCFNKQITKIYETLNLFLLCVGKERIFILPKRCLKDGENITIKQIFKDGMKENYLQKF